MIVSENIIVSDADYKIIIDALENPPKANKKLIEAMREYKKMIDTCILKLK